MDKLDANTVGDWIKDLEYAYDSLKQDYEEFLHKVVCFKHTNWAVGRPCDSEILEQSAICDEARRRFDLFL